VSKCTTKFPYKISGLQDFLWPQDVSDNFGITTLLILISFVFYFSWKVKSIFSPLISKHTFVAIRISSVKTQRYEEQSEERRKREREESSER
jgi:hypothetical protein